STPGSMPVASIARRGLASRSCRAPRRPEPDHRLSGGQVSLQLPSSHVQFLHARRSTGPAKPRRPRRLATERAVQKPSMPPVVHLLGTAVFAQGTSEFMVAGLVPDIASDMSVS